MGITKMIVFEFWKGKFLYSKSILEIIGQRKRVFFSKSGLDSMTFSSILVEAMSKKHF